MLSIKVKRGVAVKKSTKLSIAVVALPGLVMFLVGITKLENFLGVILLLAGMIWLGAMLFVGYLFL